MGNNYKSLDTYVASNKEHISRSQQVNLEEFLASVEDDSTRISDFEKTLAQLLILGNNPSTPDWFDANLDLQSPSQSPLSAFLTFLRKGATFFSQASRKRKNRDRGTGFLDIEGFVPVPGKDIALNTMDDKETGVFDIEISDIKEAFTHMISVIEWLLPSLNQSVGNVAEVETSVDNSDVSLDSILLDPSFAHVELVFEKDNTLFSSLCNLLQSPALDLWKKDQISRLLRHHAEWFGGYNQATLGTIDFSTFSVVSGLGLWYGDRSLIQIGSWWSSVYMFFGDRAVQNRVLFDKNKASLDTFASIDRCEGLGWELALQHLLTHDQNLSVSLQTNYLEKISTSTTVFSDTRFLELQSLYYQTVFDFVVAQKNQDLWLSYLTAIVPNTGKSHPEYLCGNDLWLIPQRFATFNEKIKNFLWEVQYKKWNPLYDKLEQVKNVLQSEYRTSATNTVVDAVRNNEIQSLIDQFMPFLQSVFGAEWASWVYDMLWLFAGLDPAYAALQERFVGMMQLDSEQESALSSFLTHYLDATKDKTSHRFVLSNGNSVPYHRLFASDGIGSFFDIVTIEQYLLKRENFVTIDKKLFEQAINQKDFDSDGSYSRLYFVDSRWKRELVDGWEQSPLLDKLALRSYVVWHVLLSKVGGLTGYLDRHVTRKLNPGLKKDAKNTVFYDWIQWAAAIFTFWQKPSALEWDGTKFWSMPLVSQSPATVEDVEQTVADSEISFNLVDYPTLCVKVHNNTKELVYGDYHKTLDVSGLGTDGAVYCVFESDKLLTFPVHVSDEETAVGWLSVDSAAVVSVDFSSSSFDVSQYYQHADYRDFFEVSQWFYSQFLKYYLLQETTDPQPDFFWDLHKSLGSWIRERLLSHKATDVSLDPWLDKDNNLVSNISFSVVSVGDDPNVSYHIKLSLAGHDDLVLWFGGKVSGESVAVSG